MEMEERVNVKILELTTKNKEMKKSWLRWQPIQRMVGPKEERKGLEWNRTTIPKDFEGV
jgi:hypothetical protein